MSSFFSWDLVWEFFPKILSALPVTLLIVGIATLVGLVLGSFIAFEYCEQIEPPVRMIEPASAINRATQCNRESH